MKQEGFAQKMGFLSQKSTCLHLEDRCPCVVKELFLEELHDRSELSLNTVAHCLLVPIETGVVVAVVHAAVIITGTDDSKHTGNLIAVEAEVLAPGLRLGRSNENTLAQLLVASFEEVINHSVVIYDAQIAVLVIQSALNVVNGLHTGQQLADALFLKK